MAELKKKQRRRIRKNGSRKLRSHIIWDKTHPSNPVRPGEIVHHRDGNGDKDIPSNLRKLSGRSIHMKIHWRDPEFRKKVEVASVKIRRTSEYKENLREGVITSWKNLKARRNRLAGMKEYYDTEEAKQSKSKAMRKRYADPEQRRMTSEIMKRIWRKRKQIRKIKRM